MMLLKAAIVDDEVKPEGDRLEENAAQVALIPVDEQVGDKTVVEGKETICSQNTPALGSAVDAGAVRCEDFTSRSSP